MALPSPDGSVCFYFELTGPDNRIIVDYHETALTVLGCRRLPSLEEEPAAAAAARLGRPDAAVRCLPGARSFEDLLAAFADINPLRQEGFVVVDGAWRRVKVKHPGYVSLHHLESTAGVGRLRAVVNVVRAGEVEEVVASLPRCGEALRDAARRYEAVVAAVEAHHGRLRGIEGQREFAQEATKTPYSAVLFLLRNGAASSVRGALGGMSVDHVMGLLGYSKDTEISLASAKEKA
jgi:hypothetical protein